VFYNGEWGTVCHSQYFSTTTVVCNMLGYRYNSFVLFFVAVNL